ncbi:6432_t:CDS:1 [Funneliformis mosseae]|uniref:6432_t:CDS:1 n=1 Tax=Funneliformis mosseae TaxID=27381 RepID=A0A9N8ZME8_FUNMO|nr:6432_t:CDS:1 [Funneliformis mosseae]
MDRRSSIDTVSTETTFEYFDESRRSSMISVSGDVDYYDYEHEPIALFDDVNPLVDESKLSYPVVTSSDEFNNVCVDNAFNFMMEGVVTPENDSEVNPYNFFDFGYQTHTEPLDFMQFNNFDLNSYMPSPEDQMICERPIGV